MEMWMKALYEKLDKAYELPIIGLYSFSDTDIETIREKILAGFSERDAKNPSRVTAELLLVWLIHQSKKWGEGDESKYWERMVELLVDDSQISLNNNDLALYDQFESILKRKGKEIFRSKQGKRMIRETILFHAFAPKRSVESLVGLLLDIYLAEDGFDRQIAEDEPLFKKIQQWLTQLFSLEDDTSLSCDMPFESKTYQMRAAIKYGFRQLPDTMCALIRDIIVIIDHLQYGEYIEPDIIADCCRKVFSQFGVTINKKRNSEIERVRRVPDFSKINPAYALDDSFAPYIKFPDISCSDMEISKCYLEIFSRNECVYQELLRITGYGPKRKVCHKLVYLADLFQFFREEFDLSFVVRDEHEILYDSKELLYRKFVLFKNGSETKKSTNPINCPYTIVLPQNASKEAIPYDVTFISPQVYSFIATEQAIVQYNLKTVLFGSHNWVAHILERSEAEKRVNYIEDDTECYVYKELKQLTIQFIEKSVADKVFLVHNNKNYGRLSLVSNKDNEGNCVVSDFAFFESRRINCIKLVDATAKVLLDFAYFIEPSLDVCFSPEVIYANEAAHVQILSGQEGTCVDVSCVADHLEYFSGKFRIVQPVLLWGLDEKPVHNAPLPGFVWKKKLRNNAQLKLLCGYNRTPNVMINQEYGVHGNKTAEFEWTFPVSDCIAHYCDINPSEQIDVSVEIETKSFPIFSVIYSERILHNPIILFDSKKQLLTFDARSCFFGDDDSLFEITLENEMFRKTINTSVYEHLNLEIPDGYYDIRIALDTSTPFVKTTPRELISIQDHLLGNPDISYFNCREILFKKTRIYDKSEKISGRITNIEYIDTNADRPLYIGKMRISGYTHNVEFEVERCNLHCLKAKLDEACNLPITFDKNTGELCFENCDNKRYFEIKSIYFMEQEV